MNRDCTPQEALDYEINRLPGSAEVLTLLQRLPRTELEQLAHGLIDHVGISLRHRDLLEAAESMNGWHSTAKNMADRVPAVTRYNEYIYDISDINQLKKFLESDELSPIEKSSFAYRLQKVQARVDALEPKPTMPPPVELPKGKT